jgi:glycosyltransferase involved in cell wall biosynthesis
LRQSFLQNIPVQVIHNGVDTSAFCPEYDARLLDKYKFLNQKVILGVASTWDERKGLAEFVSLRGLLPKDFSIVLVGLSSKQIEALPPGIIGIPRTESLAELNALYARADVYANPTFQDNFPNTNIEALACGTPIVAYRTGGCPEAVDSNTGIIVDKGDIDGMAAGIRRLTNLGKAVYQSQCRERALAHFNKTDRYLDYLALYQALLSAPST